MRRTFILALFSLALNGTGLAQGLFDDCSKNLFRLSKPESWQRDSTQGRTFVRNCHASTTYLVLYNDSTFQYKVDRCATGVYAEGKWKMISRRRIELYDNGTTERKILTDRDHSWLTYLTESVANTKFRTNGKDLIKID